MLARSAAAVASALAVGLAVAGAALPFGTHAAAVGAGPAASPVAAAQPDGWVRVSPASRPVPEHVTYRAPFSPQLMLAGGDWVSVVTSYSGMDLEFAYVEATDPTSARVAWRYRLPNVPGGLSTNGSTISFIVEGPSPGQDAWSGLPQGLQLVSLGAKGHVVSDVPLGDDVPAGWDGMATQVLPSAKGWFLGIQPPSDAIARTATCRIEDVGAQGTVEWSASIPMCNTFVGAREPLELAGGVLVADGVWEGTAAEVRQVVAALNTATGKVIWIWRQIGTREVYGISGGRLLAVGVGTGGLALNIRTGTVAWRLPGDCLSVVANGSHTFCLRAGRLMVYASATGRLDESFPVDKAQYLLGASSRVILLGDSTEAWVVDLRTRQAVAHYPVELWPTASPPPTFNLARASFTLTGSTLWRW